MLRFAKGVGMVAVLLAAGIALSVSAADKEPAPAGQPAIPKLTQKAADEPATEKGGETADPFVVPDGTPKELVEYIMQLIAKPPRDAGSMKKLRQTVLKAAEKILAGKPDQEEMEFAVEAKMNVLENPEQLAEFAAELKKDGQEKSARQVRGFMLQVDLSKTAVDDHKQIRKSIEEAVKFLEESPPQPRDIRLAFMVGRLSEMAQDNEFAIHTYASLAKVFATSKDATVAEFTKVLEGVGRRLDLVGHELKIEGKVLGGEEFDWSKYQGKVVLVEFWATGYPTSVRDIPDMKECYEAFHDKGFEIVGVSLDRNLAELEAFVKAKGIPWTIVTGDGKPSPSVIYYGVVSLPTTILVGKDGKVISLNTNVESLKKELEKLLGSAGEKTSKEDKSDK